MKHRRLLAVAALVASFRPDVALADGGVRSADEIKAAESDFNHGREAYKSGSYEEAAEYFEGADGHAPNEKVLELAIEARQKAGNIDRAATLSELALETYPNSERVRKIAAPLVDRGRSEGLQVTVDCSEACSLVDGTRLVHGAAALRRMIFLTPGDHTIGASWSDDRVATKVVTGNAGDSVSVSFTAPPIPKKEAAPVGPTANPVTDQGVRDESHGLSPVVFWIGAGATAVLGGITIWSGLDTVNDPGADAVKRDCVNAGTSCSEYQDGRSKQLRTNVLIGATSLVGAATVVVGGFLTNWSGEKTAAPAQASIGPWVSYDHGPSVGAIGSF